MNTLDHETHDCPKRQMICPQGCREILWHEEQDFHLEHQCSMRPVACPNVGCRETRVPAAKLNNHLATSCAYRQVPCPNLCLTHPQVLAHRLDSHLDEECSRRLLSCPLQCGETSLVFENLAGHEKKNCSRRIVRCRNRGCTVEDLEARDRETHETHHCPVRIIECPLGCDISGLTWQNQEEHTSRKCPHRLLRCNFSIKTKGREATQVTCPAWYPAMKETFHRTKECVGKWVSCPRSIEQDSSDALGLLAQEIHCTMKVRQVHLEHHLLHECPDRPVVCPNACVTVRRVNDL